MANGTVEFTLVSPEKHILTDHVDMVVVPGEAGEFGVLPNHAAMISTLRPGLVTLYKGDEKRHVFITEGFANVTETACTVLAETSEFVEDMDVHAMEKRLIETQEELSIARSDSERAELERMGEMLALQIQLIKTISGSHH